MTFPISRDPPEGGTDSPPSLLRASQLLFPISRDPPEGGTHERVQIRQHRWKIPFPISRDPPEGGTIQSLLRSCAKPNVSNF